MLIHPYGHPVEQWCFDRLAQGIVKAVGKALDKEPKVLLYSPEEVGTGKSGKAEGFPFRWARFRKRAQGTGHSQAWVGLQDGVVPR